MKQISLIVIAILFCLNTIAQYEEGIRIELLLKTDTTLAGQDLKYPGAKKDEITMMKITIKPGQSTGWHKHDFPVFAYVLQGDLTVTYENNDTVHYSANSAIPEVLNIYHNGSNQGTEDVVLLAFYIGIKGKALSIKKEQDL